MNPVLLAAIALLGIVLAGTGICSILFSAGVLSLHSAAQFLATLAGKAILYAFGGLLLAVSGHYASLFFRGRAQIARFSQEGEWGRIELSPYALREFVSGIMRDEIGIDRFQVRLSHVDDGLSIEITTTLSPTDRVSEVGKTIQETLSRRVVERTGVEVRRVEVLVNSIRQHGAQMEAEEEEGENEHPDAS